MEKAYFITPKGMYMKGNEEMISQMGLGPILIQMEQNMLENEKTAPHLEKE